MSDDKWIALTKCFYCGDSNEIVMAKDFRRNIKDTFHGKIANLRPCSNCAAAMKLGVIIIQVRDGELAKGVKLEDGGPYRTGRQVVLREEAARRLFKEGHASLRARWCFIEESLWREIGFPEEDEDCSRMSEAKPHWPTAACKKCGAVRPVRPDWNEKPDKHTIKARCLTCHPNENDQDFTLEAHEFHKYISYGTTQHSAASATAGSTEVSGDSEKRGLDQSGGQREGHDAAEQSAGEPEGTVPNTTDGGD